jgi:hypothetical protein
VNAEDITYCFFGEQTTKRPHPIRIEREALEPRNGALMVSVVA